MRVVLYALKFFLFFFNRVWTGTHYIAQASLKYSTIFLSQLPES